MSGPHQGSAGIRWPSVTRVYRVFGRHYRDHLRGIAIAYLGLSLTVVFALLSPWPLKLILDHVVLGAPLPARVRFLERVAGSDRIALLGVLVAAFVLVRMSDSLAGYLHKVGLLTVGEKLSRDVRNRIFAHLQRLSMAFHGRAATGDLVYRMASDVGDLRVLMIEVPDLMLYRLLTLASHAALMLALEWRLALVSFAMLPALYAFNRTTGEGVKAAARRKRAKESDVANAVLENVTTMALIQAYGRQDLEEERFRAETRASLEFSLAAMRLSKVFKRTSDLLIALGTCAVVYVGGRLALSGAILPGTLVLFAVYLKNLYKPVDKIAEMVLDIASAQASGERLADLAECELVMEDAPDAVDLPRPAGRIVFEGVRFRYRPDTLALDDVSFTLEPGERVALVGPNGAGKSTLVALLLRFHDPEAGRITIDGHDLRAVKLASLRRHIGVVFQGASLFERSVRDNIAFGKPDATEEEIVRAARLAQADAFITRQPSGYDAKIAEGDDNLSGGERQRLNIARAIVRDAPVVVLDEPATALDPRTASRVQRALDELTRGRTSIVVAHRLTTVAGADKVLVLDRGRVAAFGTPAEAMRQSPWYRTLVQVHDSERAHPETCPPAAAAASGEERCR